MAEVSVNINGKTYGIACDEGQESRVRELARYVDERLRSLSEAGAASSESQNLVLTAIILADEIADLRDYIENSGGQDSAEPRVEVREVEVPVQIPPAISEEDEAQFAEAIGRLAERIDSLANKIAKAA